MANGEAQPLPAPLNQLEVNEKAKFDLEEQQNQQHLVEGQQPPVEQSSLINQQTLYFDQTGKPLALDGGA